MKSLYALLFVMIIPFTTSFAQSTSCQDRFRDFTPIDAAVHPVERNSFYTYDPTLTWYDDCILIGSEAGLLLYDIQQPDSPLVLATVEERAINNVAVNPADMTIAFSVVDEPQVYLINAGGAVSTLEVSGQAITSISFSSDGSLMAIGSIDLFSAESEELSGMYHDAIMQILDTNYEEVARITYDSPYIVIRDAVFSENNQNIWIYGATSGYEGLFIEFWNIGPLSLNWDYDELFVSRKKWSANDPFLATNAVTSGEIMALGGQNGYMGWDEYYGTGVNIWNIETKTRLSDIVIDIRDDVDDYLSNLTLNHDGSILVTEQANGLIRFWNVSTGTEINDAISINDDMAVQQLAYSPDDQYLAILTEEALVIYEVEQMQELTSFQFVQHPASTD